MRVEHRIGIAALTAALAAGPCIGRAGVPTKPVADPPVDERLLEFLGTVDDSAGPRAAGQSGAGGWLAYLSQIDIGKVAKSPQAEQASQGRPPKPVSAPGGADKPGGQGGTKP